MSKKLISRLLTILILAIFAVYFVLNIEQFKLLTKVNVLLIGVVLLLNVIAMLANGFFTKFVMQPFGKQIPLGESVYVTLISSVGNYFAPAGGGFAFRAAYLKKVHGLNYEDYTATLYGNYIIVFAVNSFFALVALFLLRGTNSTAYFTLNVLFAGLFLITLSLSLIKIPTRLLESNVNSRLLGKFARIIFGILEGWNRIISNKRLLAKLCLLIGINFVISVLVSLSEIKALHLHITFPALLLFSVLGSLSLFVSITPANLGVKEAIYIFSSAVIGFSTPQILSIALLDRAILFLTLLGLWLVMTRQKSFGMVRSRVAASTEIIKD